MFLKTFFYVFIHVFICMLFLTMTIYILCYNGDLNDSEFFSTLSTNA